MKEVCQVIVEEDEDIIKNIFDDKSEILVNTSDIYNVTPINLSKLNPPHSKELYKVLDKAWEKSMKVLEEIEKHNNNKNINTEEDHIKTIKEKKEELNDLNHL